MDNLSNMTAKINNFETNQCDYEFDNFIVRCHHVYKFDFKIFRVIQIWLFWPKKCLYNPQLQYHVK